MGSRKKDKTLNARIPEALDRELRAHARRLDMPVSQLVRSILQRTVDLVGNLSGNVEHLVADVVDDVASFRHVGAAESGDAPDDAGVSPRAELDAVLGWQELRLASPATCAVTGRALSAGETALVGVRDDGLPGPIASEEGVERLLAAQRASSAWTRVVVQRPVRCVETGAELEVGSPAWFRRDPQSGTPVFLSQRAYDAVMQREESDADRENGGVADEGGDR